MKIIQVPFTYYPDPVGGTEIYVESLVRGLKNLGVETVIAAPGVLSRDYDWDGIPVRRFAVSSHLGDVAEMYGEGDRLAALEFDKILELEKPDLVHLHAHTRAISLKLLNVVRARQIPIIFTYHTPTVTCQRGTMLRWGREECNGVMEPLTCAACSLHGNGVPKILSHLIARIPNATGTRLGRMGLRGGIWTALRTRSLVTLKHASTQKFLNKMDHIVAVCQWVQNLLLRNNVDANNITLCRQGLPQANYSGIPERSHQDGQKGILRLVFLGRLDPTKGIEVLLKAMSLIPECKVSLDIYGVVQGNSGKDYEAKLHHLSSNDSRIRFLPPIPISDVVETLAKYDVLAVPSQWMETGPIVVLEAFAAGISVIGSDLGGIAELVQDKKNGLLVEPANPRSWADAVSKMADAPESFLPGNGKTTLNTMKMVGDIMKSLYEKIITRKKEMAIKN